MPSLKKRYNNRADSGPFGENTGILPEKLSRFAVRPAIKLWVNLNDRTWDKYIVY